MKLSKFLSGGARPVMIASLLALAFSMVLTSCGGSSSGGGSTGDEGGGTTSGTFLSQLSVSPDGVFTDTSYNVTAHATLAASATSVVLEKVSSSDSTTATKVSDLATMYDDGDATSHGDDIASDNVYSAIVPFTETTGGNIYVRVNADGTYSTIKTIAVLTPLTTVEWDAVMDTPNSAKDIFDAASGSTDADKAANSITAIKALTGVANAGVSEDGQGIWIVYDSGVLGGFVFNEETSPSVTALGDSETEPPSTDSTVTSGAVTSKGGRGNGKAVVISPHAWQPIEMFPSGHASFLKAAAVDTNAVASKSAILLSPFYWQFRGYDDYWGAGKRLRESTCPKFDLTQKFNLKRAAQNISPEDFKTLSNYGVVIISSHGDNWYNGLFTWWDDYFGATCANDPKKCNWLADQLSTVVILTGYKATEANKTTYENDLQQHRLVMTLDGGLGITPSFITHYNGTFPDNALVWLGSCRSTYTTAMANAFTGKGAGTVVGFTDYVSSAYCRDIGLDFFGPDSGLLKLTPSATSVSTAKAAAIASRGANDGVAAYDNNNDDPAEFTLHGSSDTNLNVSAINNGGFEEGSAIGWASGGDYRVQAVLGAVDAPEGVYMGVISTGLGTYTGEGYSTGGVESSLYQSFCVPAGVTTLSFNYDVITEEAMCYVGSAYNDTFTATLRDADSGSVLVTGATETVNASSWSFLGGDYFSGGDDYSTPQTCENEFGSNVYDDGTYHTGWKTGTIDVSSYAGQQTPVQLYFYVADEGDSAWDTAVTIDDVTLE